MKKSNSGMEGKLEDVESVGIDLGDRKSDYAIFDMKGTVIERGSVETTAPGLQKLLSRFGRAVVAIEVGMHSPWVSRLIKAAGHEALVANARKVALIGQNRRKNNRIDAEILGRLARVDRSLLFPIVHRSEESQRGLAMLRARDTLVRQRTRLINHVRGASKAIGKVLSRCGAEVFAKRCVSELPAVLGDALGPVIEQITLATASIRAYDRKITAMATSSPAATQLMQVRGVGAVTAMAYVLVIDDAKRFGQSRAVGAYLGLIPGTDDTGDTHTQRRITREGDPFLRRLLVSSAQYMLGPFGEDCTLKRYGQAIAARGGKNGKKRAVVAVARKLAVLLHRLWVSGEAYDRFRNTEQPSAQECPVIEQSGAA